MVDDRWREVIESARALIRNELTRPLVAAIDKAASGDAVAVFEGLETQWYPRCALYLVTYVRLLDRGYPVEFDLDYFRGLSGVPEGLVEAMRERAGAITH